MKATANPRGARAGGPRRNAPPSQGPAMSPSPVDPLIMLGQAFDGTEAPLREPDPARRAAGLAAVLRALAPGASLCACRLTDGGRFWAAVLDQDGADRSESAALIEGPLARPDGGATAAPREVQLDGRT